MRFPAHYYLPFALALVATGAPAQEAATSPANPVLQGELLELRRIDQAALRDKTMAPEALEKLQDSNTKRLKDIVQKHGWPTLSMVGNDAAQGPWLVVQHADKDHAWQRHALALMEALVPGNEVRKTDVAYLRDRLDIADGGTQRYGTQGRCVAKHVWQPFEITDAEHLEERRKAMDMMTEEAYLKLASRMCANFETK